MSSISGLNAYASSVYQYSQTSSNDESSSRLPSTLGRSTLLGLTTNKASSRRTQSQTSNLLSEQSLNVGISSLTDQISSLVRLTRYAMDSMGLSADSRVTFSQLKKYCTEVEERFSSAVQQGLSSLAVDPKTVTYTYDEQGELSAHSASPLNESLANFGIENEPRAAEALVSQLQSRGLTQGVSFTLGQDGTVSFLGNTPVSPFQCAASLSLLKPKIDADIDFSLQNKNGVLMVNCADARYTDVLQSFFDENPSIVADYQRTEALSGIEDVRKFMRLSPQAMRTRLQLESMVNWWDTSGQSQLNSTFGMYSGGLYSRMNGVNVSV